MVRMISTSAVDCKIYDHEIDGHYTAHPNPPAILKKKEVVIQLPKKLVVLTPPIPVPTKIVVGKSLL